MIDAFAVLGVRARCGGGGGILSKSYRQLQQPQSQQRTLAAAAVHMY
jgi:hypothetical protein